MSDTSDALRQPERARPYARDDLKRAVAGVTSKAFSLAFAAVLFRIPASTLRDHVAAAQRGEAISDRPGPGGKVSVDDQAVIVRWAQLRALMRFPVSPKQMRACAGKIAAARGTPFKHGVASRKWYRKVFYPKWKQELDAVKPSKIKPGQCALTMESLQETYDVFVRLNEEYGLQQSDWYNFDEVGFDKVAGGKGKRLKGKKQSRCEFFQPFTEHVTIGATIRADGARLPPFYLFKGSPTADHDADVAALMMKDTEDTGAGYTWTGRCSHAFGAHLM